MGVGLTRGQLLLPISSICRGQALFKLGELDETEVRILYTCSLDCKRTREKYMHFVLVELS